jgi:hypothetical protein
MAALATANNGVLITSAGGVPSILADGTTGQVLTATTGSPPSWAPAAGITGTTTQYDVIVGAGASSVGAVGPGTAGQALLSGGNAANPAYSTPTYPSASGSAGQILRSDGTNNVYSTSTYPNTNAAGDLRYGSATNVLSNLAISATPGVPLTSTGALPAWNNPFQALTLLDYFTNSSAPSTLGWSEISGGTGAGNNYGNVTVDSGHPGNQQFATGTTTTGYCGLTLGNTSTPGLIIPGGGACDIYWVVQLPVLSVIAQRYIYVAGIGQTNNAAAPWLQNGIYFQYSDSINSGQWQIIATIGGVATTTNTTIAAGTTFTTLHLSINAGWTSVTGYINGVSGGTVASGLPTAGISPIAFIQKTLGTTSRLSNQNMFYLYQSLTSAR